MRLSKHFSLEEMTRSMVAARKGIDNTPGAGEIKNLGTCAMKYLNQFVHILTSLLWCPLATAARHYVKQSAAKKRRSMLRAKRLTSKSTEFLILKSLIG